MKHLFFILCVFIYACSQPANNSASKLDSLQNRAKDLYTLNSRQRDTILNKRSGLSDSVMLKVNARKFETDLDIKRTELQIDISKK